MGNLHPIEGIVPATRQTARHRLFSGLDNQAKQELQRAKRAGAAEPIYIDTKPMFTIPQAADRTGLPYEAIYNMVRRGKLIAHLAPTVGRLWLIPAEQLEKLMTDTAGSPAEPVTEELPEQLNFLFPTIKSPLPRTTKMTTTYSANGDLVTIKYKLDRLENPDEFLADDFDDEDIQAVVD